MSSVDSSLDQLRKLADRRKKVALEARVAEPVIAAALAWFLCGSLAFGIGLLTVGFVKAVGLSIILSIAGAVLVFAALSIRIYRQVTEEVNAEFAKLAAEAAKSAADVPPSWPQFVIPDFGRDCRYIRRDSEDTAFIVQANGEFPFAWGYMANQMVSKGEYKTVSEAEAKAVLK